MNTTSSISSSSISSSSDAPKTDWLEVARQNVANLRFGSVQITIHDGRVTQVESVEKTRFVAPRENGSSVRK